MQTNDARGWLRLSVEVASVTLCLAGSAAAQATLRVSVDSAGAQGNNDSGGDRLWMSADGRYLAFCSDASNLVTGDTNNVVDVFVRDRQLGLTERVSVDSAGAQAIGSISDFPAISDDGRYVAFRSAAANLVTGDTNGTWDVFVRDRVAGTTGRVSVSSAGAQANSLSGMDGTSMSSGGRFVVFSSGANNLVTGDTNNMVDVFIRDRQLGLTARVSVDSTGVQGNGNSGYPTAISADGRYIAFESQSSNLVAADTNGNGDVFVFDSVSGTTERVSVNSAGAQVNGANYVPAISGDGRYVAFGSNATNLVAGDTNAFGDIFVRDRVGGTTERVSVDSAGTQSNAHSGDQMLSISPDGRYVAFMSQATNLVAGDTNGSQDIFVRDRQAATTERVSVDSAGAQGNGNSYFAWISGDGRHVALASDASNLVAGDTNLKRDVFVRDGGCSSPLVNYCTAGTTTNGCLAAISGTGTPSASAANGFTLSVSSVEGQKQGLMFYGVDNTGFTPTSWGTSSSFLCVKSPTQRTTVLLSGGTNNLCDGVLALDWNAFRAANPSALGAPFAAGQQICAQAWFRDPPSPKTTQLSNGLQFTLCP